MNPNILLFQQIVPAYRVPIFRAMHRQFNSVLCHSLQNRRSKINSASHNIDFQHEIVKNYNWIGTWQQILPSLRKYSPDIVITSLATTNFTFIKLLLFRKIYHYKIIAWGHGLNNKEMSNPMQGLRGIVMKFLLKKADAIIFYSEMRKNTACKLLPSITEKCFVAKNTLDLTDIRSINANFKNIGKEQVKRELGNNFKSQFNLIFIGRLLPNKRIDLLIDALTILVKECDVALHIIGSGKDEQLIRQHLLFGKNIFYYGAIYDEVITGKYLFASDLFVMPGYVGLSIIHAFAFGIPVLTCRQDIDGPFHSPEIEYLHHNYNGILSSKDPEIIAGNIKSILENTAKLEEMKINAEITAYEKCSLETMLDGFSRAINYVYPN